MGRFPAALLLAGMTALSLAQAPGSPDLKGQRTPPPGTARDGSAPAEGAIKGGSLEPDIRSSPAPKRDVKRCKELAGKLREECLRDLRRADDAREPSQANVKKQD
jgi:hypothetical protein